MQMKLNEAPDLVLSAISNQKLKSCCIRFWCCKSARFNDAGALTDLKIAMQREIITQNDLNALLQEKSLVEIINEQVANVIVEFKNDTINNLSNDPKSPLGAALAKITKRKSSETDALLVENERDSLESDLYQYK